MNERTILVSGSLAYDRIMNFSGYFKDHIMLEKAHVISLSFAIDTVEERYGGTAGNIAYNLKLLALEPVILSAAGSDFDQYRRHLEANGIDTSFIQIIPDRKTAFASIITDCADNQIAAFYPGALNEVKVASTTPVPAAFAIVSPELKEAMMMRIAAYKEAGVTYMFDPGQQVPNFSGEELRRCVHGAHVVIGNDYEMSMLSQKSGWSTDDLTAHADIVIITLGERGSEIYTREKKITIEAVVPEKSIDPTGAGDAYRAGFVSGLVEKKTFEECGALGSRIAARAIACCGAQAHTFEYDE